MTPTILIKKWLQFAIENNIARAHAMCLSTVNANGIPSSRMILASQITYDGVQKSLILKPTIMFHHYFIGRL